MIGSPAMRRELGDDLPAGLAAHQDAAAGARVADAGADPPRAPALVGGQVGEVGPVALAGVDDVVALGAHGGEHAADRLDRRAGQREVVAHRVDIAAGAAEIGLHVDDDERRVVGPEIAVERPGIGVGRRRCARAARRPWRTAVDCVMLAAPHLVIDSSPGAPRERALGRGRDDHDEEGQHVGRGVEEVVALRDADRLQRRAERAGGAEEERRAEAGERVPAREDDQRHRHQALARRQALVPAARDSRATGRRRRRRREKPPAAVARKRTQSTE